MKEDFEIEDQRPDEEIVLIKNMHPWVLSKAAFVAILLILITVLSFLIFSTGLISIIILALSVIIIIFYGSIKYFLYKSAFFILTNHRIINISQGSLLKRTVQETELENIYNIQYRISGLMQSFLNFGDIELTTQGDETNVIKIRNIENPHFIHEKISVFRKRAVNRHR